MSTFDGNKSKMFEWIKKIFNEKKDNLPVLETEKSICTEPVASVQHQTDKKWTFDDYRVMEEEKFVSSVDPSKYLVLDVETNGLSSKRDDLLSLAIYKPDTDEMFIKYFPLELNDSVKTTDINGITKKDLKNATPLSQDEYNDLIVKYDIQNRTVLTYSGFDKRFLGEYFHRHHLDGFELINFYNFKQDIISSRFSEGNITKDNLCGIFKINNVKDIHSADNDCILEWKLFQRMNGGQLLITNNKVFEFNLKEYIVPISYVSCYPNLKYHMPPLPRIFAMGEPVKVLTLDQGFLKKFPTNFNGLVIEHVINSMIQARMIDSRSFLLKNKSKLKYVGKLDSAIDVVPLDFKEDGTLGVVRPQDKALVNELNTFVGSLKNQLWPLVDFIKDSVFHGEEILSQELVIHPNENILALCDLSSKSSVLEIKMTTYSSPNSYARQIYYEANGREAYLLQVDWSQLPNRLPFILSKIRFEISESISQESQRMANAKRKIESEGVELLQYIDSHSSVRLKCKKCGYEWSCSYLTAKKGMQCPRCYPSKERKSRVSRVELSPELKLAKRERFYQEKVTKKSEGKIEAYNYKGADKDVSARCLICGYEWSTRADHLLERCRCVKCKGMPKNH